LTHAGLFATIQQPRAWFLAIAANVIKRKRTSRARRGQREFTTATVTGEQISESDFFDQVNNFVHPSPEHEVEARSQVEEMLSLVAPEDQRILRLAFLQDLDTQSLALALRITAGTARVRLHRALQRARIAWQQQQEREKVRNERFQREQALFRYTSALERGDIDTVIAVLHEAEQDPMLEQMIFETHAALQQEETMHTQQQSPYGHIPAHLMKPGQLNTYREPTHQQTKRSKRWLTAFSTLAAVFVAALVLASALLFFASHRPVVTNHSHGTNTGSKTVQPPDPGVAVFSTSDGTIHASNATTGKALWQFHTVFSQEHQEVNGPVGLLVQQHVIYFASKGEIYAINAATGQQLWHTSLHTGDQWNDNNNNGQRLCWR
jgi:RNA polymerase sigma factor (sigma-70 family)